MSEERENANDLRQLVERLDYLESQLHRQTGRIHELERRLGIWSPAVSPPTVTAPAPTVADRSGKVPTRSIRLDLSSVRRVDWERLIGGNWFSRVGILAIILGVGFFLKYAFENQWLGPLGRVLLGAVTGCALLLAGDRIRRRGYRFYAHGLSGGGLCILYLSIYAACDRFHLIGEPVAMTLMALVTVLTVLLAARYDALAIAILGLVGGFLTPVLLAGEEDRQSALFAYLTLLDLGVLGVAWFKRWRILNYLAGAATFLLSLAWWLEWYQPGKLVPTLLHLTILFLIFAFTGVTHQVVRKEPAREPELALIIINAGLYFAALHAMLESDHRNWLSGGALLLAAFYCSQAYWIRRQGGNDRYLELALVGLAGVFLTMAVPLRFSLSAVTIGWAVEGLALIWLGLRSGRRSTRVGGGLVLALAVIHWIEVDLTALSPATGSHFLIMFNWRGVPIAVTMAALLLAAWLYRRMEFTVSERERGTASGALALIAALLLVAWITLDQWDYFRLLEDPYRGAEWNHREISRLQQQSQFFVGAWWAFSGLALVVAGIRRRAVAARLPGLLLLLLAGVLSVAAGVGHDDQSWQVTLLNLDFGLHVVLALALAGAYREYRRAGDGMQRHERSALMRLLLTGANLSLLGGLSLEIDSFLDRHPGLGEGGLVEQAGQSILCASYGAALIAFGAWRSNRQIRRLGLLTLALTIGKVFLFDLAALEQVYRIASFVALGVILLLVSWHYQRRSGEAD